MKNKRRFLASVALGIFLTAVVSPIITADQKLEVDKTKIRIPGSKKK